MRSSEARILLMHQRADEITKSKRNRRVLLLTGGAGSALFVVLFGLIVQLQGLSEGVSEDSFAASTLLSESAGGYVLVAVIAFMLGVLIATLLSRHNRKKHVRYEESDKAEQK